MQWLAVPVIGSVIALHAANATPAPSVLFAGRRVVIGTQTGTASRSLAVRRTGGADALTLPFAAFRDGNKLTANVRPFLGQKGLLDVIITERWREGWHAGSREVHFVLDTAGGADVLACRFGGAEQSSGEYASSSTTITLRQTAANPLAFDVVRQTTARQVQPKTTSQTTGAVDHYVLGTPSCASPP